GATINPPQSMVWVPVRLSPTATMRACVHRTSARRAGPPVPSMTVPPRKTSSDIGQRSIQLGSTIAIELPLCTHFGNHREIALGVDEFVAIAAGLRQNAAARITEIALSVKFADVPRLLVSDPIVGADEIAICHGMRRLLELPQIFGMAGRGGARNEDDLGAAQAQRSRALGEMAVVADVDADPRKARLEGRITQIAGPEIKLFPESGQTMRDVCLAILAEIRAIGIN